MRLQMTFLWILTINIHLLIDSIYGVDNNNFLNDNINLEKHDQAIGTGEVDIKPNIVFIMVDDLGWGNVGYHNKENPEVSTPNIDYLVENGLELNRHYVDAECSPTRSSFQSGRLPVHVNENNNDGITDPTMGVHPDMTCIATKLKQGGYSTHAIGKWDAGFASRRQIPKHRGYDTFYGYLGKSIDYFTKKGDGDCTEPFIDLWQNDSPAKESVEAVETDEYVEYTFAKKVLTKIDEEAENYDPDKPFFLFYASHLPHYPSQLPEDCIEKGYYVEFEDDESMCNEGNSYIYPGYSSDLTQWKCRSILQAQVSILDDIVGKITARLKNNNLWDNTLIVFTTDNGGSYELSETAGNNYPLRGGKASFLEGGIRATSFVSGGYLPEDRRGDKEEGIMHIADWYVTFSEMAGIDANDYHAMGEGLPNVDGMNMWPLISGITDESPRLEIMMNKNTLIVGDYKLIVGKSTKYAIWTSAMFPNSSTPSQDELASTYIRCDRKQNFGCLFNVVEDPSEYNDIAAEYPDMTRRMHNRLVDLRTKMYASDFYGKDACPEQFDEKSAIVSELEDDNHGCGCWMAEHNYHSFAGPYQDLMTINYDQGPIGGEKGRKDGEEGRIIDDEEDSNYRMAEENRMQRIEERRQKIRGDTFRDEHIENHVDEEPMEPREPQQPQQDQPPMNDNDGVIIEGEDGDGVDGEEVFESLHKKGINDYIYIGIVFGIIIFVCLIVFILKKCRPKWCDKHEMETERGFEDSQGLLEDVDVNVSSSYGSLNEQV